MVSTLHKVQCNTPVPQRFWLILHSSEARFISSDHTTEGYCATVRWIWFVFVDYQVSVWRVRCDLMRWKYPMKELSTELSSPSDAIFDPKSSQCWINVESGSDVSQVRVVQLWDVSSRCLTKVCWVSDDDSFQRSPGCNLQSAWQPSLVQHSSEGNMIFSTVIQHS